MGTQINTNNSSKLANTNKSDLNTQTTKQRVLTQDDVNFEKGTKVISAAQKYIITVPKMPGEPLVNPETQEQIKDWKGNPIGDEGIVFWNGKDQGYQAVQTDGNGVLILNEVTKDVAEKLDYIIAAHSKDGTPSGCYDYKHLKACLTYAQKALGITDMYNSDNKFISSKMSSVGEAKTDASGNSYGLMKRDDRDVCEAVYVKGNYTLKTGDREHVAKGGLVVLKQGEDIRGIQPDVFERTYRKADGSNVTLADLELYTPEK